MMITNRGFYLSLGTTGVAVRLVNAETQQVANFAKQRMDAADVEGPWSQTLLRVSYRQSRAQLYYVEIPKWVPTGVYDVLAYDSLTPAKNAEISYFEQLTIPHRKVAAVPADARV
jgi:hypothetical protein